MALLEADHLQIEFQTERGLIQAVRGVSFSVEAGETLAIVGESGCGKSVLCRALMRLLPGRGRLAGGVVRFQGRNLAALSERELCAIRGKELSMVFQNPMTALDPSMTVGAQIAETLRVHRLAGREEAAARAIELLGQMGLEEPARRARQYPCQFSGGMLQRAALAAALACSPKLLIADEPTTALDVTVQAQILSLLKELRAKTGMALLFVSHDLGVVAKLADRVAVMYAGKIVEIGTAREVFYDPRHPYTWGLLESLPSGDGEPCCIPGSPPDLLCPPPGDAFAPRNRFALERDFREEPPLLPAGGAHYAATWLLEPDAPKIKPPVRVERGRVVPNV